MADEGGGGNSIMAALAAHHAHKSSSDSGGGGGGSAAAGGLEHADGGIAAKMGLKLLGIDGGNTQTGDHLIANVGNTQQNLCPTQLGLERFNTNGFGLNLADLFSRLTSEITSLMDGVEASQVSDAPVDTSGSAGGGGGDYGGGGGGGGSAGGDYDPTPAAGGGGSSPMLVFQGHADTIEAPKLGGGGGFLAAILGGGGGGGGGMEL